MEGSPNHTYRPAPPHSPRPRHLTPPNRSPVIADMLHSRLSFDLPPAPSVGESAYVGAWQAHGCLDILHTLPKTWAHLRDENWFLACTVHQVAGERTQFIHESKNESHPIAIAFRGYLSDPSLPHWAPTEEIINYWQIHRNSRRHNGVYAAAIVEHASRRLTLISDAFGLAPFYYRCVGDAVLFSTSARFLTMPGDRVDEIAAGWLLAAGQLVDDRSLLLGINRVPAGTALQFNMDGCRRTTWYSLENLPEEAKPLDEGALSRCEEVFQESMRRIASLGGSAAVLPLSSGDDSRRILSGLLSTELPFQAITVRTSHRIGSRDVTLDSYAASELAAELGFPHQVVDLHMGKEAVAFNLDKCYLMSGESTHHDWFLSLTRQLPEGRTVIYDGAGGDVFGNTGYGIANLYAGDLARRVSSTVLHGTRTFPSPDSVSAALPSLDELRAALESSLPDVPDIQAASDLLFLRMRTRRGPAFKQQTLVRGGNLTACPYFDLDHVEATLPLDANAKLLKTIQARCLERYWPGLYRHPGSRRIPAKLDDMPTTRAHDTSGHIIQRARADLRDHFFPKVSQLRPRRRLAALAADIFVGAAQRQSWWLLASGNISRLIAERPVWKKIEP